MTGTMMRDLRLTSTTVEEKDYLLRGFLRPIAP
jgi:hypothetical protein